ncbi:type I-G CRISPR-associated protein Cas8g1/Csx17 [Rhodopirellula sp. JC639]|uniref:type I-G CRISPR-associated protein Cas8g1/Csx17 n=1 Tax=Stieleria mannarensis TaxID=2755585 RepID=UPI00160235D1|nr:type I-U CRISPR-associated protein Csx17 [Rhodopirellula sp. JC639]
MSSESIHVHKLAGCSPSPLAHYLKALGILRLVSEQVDPAARGWWRSDVFHLGTQLDRDELEHFFLNDYKPTPMTAPWNGGSGFYPTDNKSGIEPIEQSVSERFAPFREAIAVARSVVGGLDAKPDKGDAKNNVIARCRLALRDESQAWIDAALVLDDEGEPSFPALLGTGGNDGRLDFTTNQMQRLVSLFDVEAPDSGPHPESVPQLETALWSESTATLEGGAIGQFYPGAAGGPNGTSGFDGGVKVNPWDYVLMLEGALVFRSGLARRCAADALPQASAPFAVRSSGSGYCSAASVDAGARGEQWMPLWPQPSTLYEVNALFREGRSRIARKPTERATDMARSIARMGVARGVDRFVRFGYIERNGLANLAVPLGRFEVRERKHQELLDEVAPWLDRLRRLAGAKNAPAAFDRVHRACEESLIKCTQRDEPQSFLRLLETIGAAEDQMLHSPKFAAENYATPAPVLSPRWGQLILDCEDSPALRLAIALVAQYGPLQSNQPGPLPTIRDHWVPLAGRQFDKGERGLNLGPNQCGMGLDLERAMLAVVQRRLLALGRGAATKGADHARYFPLRLSHHRLGARLSDIEAFLQRRVDDGRLLSMARGMMSVRWPRLSIEENNKDPSQDPLGGLATFGVLRLALPTGPVALSATNQHAVRVNPIVFHRLSTGDLSRAIDLAMRQLSAAGLRPRVRIAIGSSDYARRLASAMAFGLSDQTFARLARSLTQPELSQSRRREMEADAMT